jgi:hypothetical protein
MLIAASSAPPQSGQALAQEVASRQTQGSAGVMGRLDVNRSANITFGADAAGTGSSVPSRLTMGDGPATDRPHIDRSRDITFGHDATSSGP